MPIPFRIAFQRLTGEVGGWVARERNPGTPLGPALMLSLLLSVHRPGEASSFQEGDSLVISQELGGFTYPSFMYEYSPSGARLQAIPIPRPGNPQARDLVADYSGRAFVFNGTFTPYLHVTLGPGQTPDGIVQFPAEGGVGVRFATGKTYIDLAAGLDGRLCALDSGGATEGSAIDVYDPVTLSYLRRIDIPFEARARGIAADALGTI